MQYVSQYEQICQDHFVALPERLKGMFKPYTTGIAANTKIKCANCIKEFATQYCISCAVVSCNACGASTHKKHTTIPLTELSGYWKDKVEPFLADAHAERKKMKKKVKSLMEKKRAIQRDNAKLQQQANDFFGTLIEQVKMLQSSWSHQFDEMKEQQGTNIINAHDMVIESSMHKVMDNLSMNIENVDWAVFCWKSFSAIPCQDQPLAFQLLQDHIEV